jgi:Arm DNA-binding domain
MRLTKRVVDALSPRHKPYVEYDIGLTGFGVAIYPSGIKSWVCEYRPHGGRRGVAKKRVTLSKVTQLTLEQARKAAVDMLAAVRLGGDPAKKPVYLSAAALAVLSTLQRIAGNPYIVPGEQNGSPRADLNRPWAAVTKAAGLDGLRLHDLRHSFASFGAGASLGLPIIGKHGMAEAKGHPRNCRTVFQQHRAEHRGYPRAGIGRADRDRSRLLRGDWLGELLPASNGRDLRARLEAQFALFMSPGLRKATIRPQSGMGTPLGPARYSKSASVAATGERRPFSPDRHTRAGRKFAGNATAIPLMSRPRF